MLDLEKLKQAVLTFMQAKNDDEEAFTCYLATLNVHVILKLIEQNKALEADLETERLRLAACGVAALGYFDGCKDEYRSASLEDTLRLYESNKELKSQLAEYKRQSQNEAEIKQLEIALRIKTEEHQCCAEDLISLSKSEQDGWKEAAIAWEVCTSIHEKWAKGKDTLYSTRHADFEKHADDARRKLPPNALAQADAACGVSPGAMGSAALVGERKHDGNA